MDATYVEDALRASLPGVPIETAPSIDLHATIYAPADDLLAVLQALRDRDDGDELQPV